MCDVCVCLLGVPQIHSPPGDDKRRFLKGYILLFIGKNEWDGGGRKPCTSYFSLEGTTGAWTLSHSALLLGTTAGLTGMQAVMGLMLSLTLLLSS